MYKYNEDSLLTSVSDNVLNKNNSYVTYNSNGSIFRMSNVKWNSNNYYSKTYDYDNFGRNTNTYITYLENEKLHKKKIQEIEYKNLYDENNHLIGIQKSVKILTNEEIFDMITYEYDKYDRLVKIGAYLVCAGIAAIPMPGARAVAGAAACVILLIDIFN